MRNYARIKTKIASNIYSRIASSIPFPFLLIVQYHMQNKIFFYIPGGFYSTEIISILGIAKD